MTRAAQTSVSWVTRPKLNPQARLRLFCFPYAGGGASVFRTWPNALPPAVEVRPVQLPGREERLREPPFARLSPLIQTLASVLHPYLDIPFAFFGHSMGALISFELARQLRRQNGPEPVHLFVSGFRAPQIRQSALPIHQLPKAEFLDELRRFNGTPEAVLQNTELLDVVLPILRADFAVYETYTYSVEKPLDCSISAYGGLQDGDVNSDELAAWRDQTRSVFTMHMFPGDHFFLHEASALFLRTMSRDLTWLLINHSPRRVSTACEM